MYRTESIKTDDFKPARFEADHTVTLNGKKIPVHTISEDNVFYNAAGKAIASIFSYSYFRSDVKDVTSRPVIFGFNGGPGSSCMYVHYGFLGTKRIVYTEDPDRPSALGPYEVIDNPDCLIDICDLVLIDPVGTGYGLLIDEEEKKQFLGIEEDAEALLNFIEAWCRRYDRMLSPKYLVGESYGCTRNANAAGIATGGVSFRSYGLAFDGLVMIGNTVTCGKYFGENIPVETSVLGFPTYAGVHWYHHHPTDQSVEEFVKEAKEWADSQYVLALYKGERLTDAERERVIKKVTYYTGVSREYLLRNNLKIDDTTFRSEVCRKEGKAVGRYDGRITRPLLEPAVREDKEGAWDDASSDRYTSYFYAATTGVILPLLGVKLDRSYLNSARFYRDWNTEEKNGTTAEKLRKAMLQRPGTRCFFANGWFDLCTETGYVYHTLDHAGLPKDRTFFKGYKSGHMIYIGEENVRELCADIRKFVEGKNPAE